MKNPTIKISRVLESINQSGRCNNTASLHQLQERHIRRRMPISHNQAKVVASLYFGDE